jgi:hypothetical protein
VPFSENETAATGEGDAAGNVWASCEVFTS